MTNWCVRYKVQTLACICIHLACTWAEHEVKVVYFSVFLTVLVQIPQNVKGEPWYISVDPEMTEAKIHGLFHLFYFFSLRVLELANSFTEIYQACGEILAFKRFANKNGTRPHSKSSSSEHPNASTSRLPPPPLAPSQSLIAFSLIGKLIVLEQKTKKVGLHEYKERQRQNIETVERPLAPQTNDSFKRASFIPDFSKGTNLEVKEMELPPCNFYI